MEDMPVPRPFSGGDSYYSRMYLDLAGQHITEAASVEGHLRSGHTAAAVVFSALAVEAGVNYFIAEVLVLSDDSIAARKLLEGIPSLVRFASRPTNDTGQVLKVLYDQGTTAEAKVQASMAVCPHIDPGYEAKLASMRRDRNALVHPKWTAGGKPPLHALAIDDTWLCRANEHYLTARAFCRVLHLPQWYEPDLRGGAGTGSAP